jgi:hypothetical protein
VALSSARGGNEAAVPLLDYKADLGSRGALSKALSDAGDLLKAG